MNKSDLAKHIAQKHSVSVAEAERQIDRVLEGIVNILAEGKDNQPQGKKQIREKLTIVGFGTFALRHVPERSHRNPQDPNAAPVVKPAHNEVLFTEGKFLTDSVN